MEAARTAVRVGFEEVSILYRRTEKELPARLEEIRHAKEEGVIFDLLTNPTEILVDDNGYVKGMKCVKKYYIEEIIKEWLNVIGDKK